MDVVILVFPVYTIHLFAKIICLQSTCIEEINQDIYFSQLAELFTGIKYEQGNNSMWPPYRILVDKTVKNVQIDLQTLDIWNA